MVMTIRDHTQSLTCGWDGHESCDNEQNCLCHCHDLLVLGHHPDCDGECEKCPVLWERDERE